MLEFEVGNGCERFIIERVVCGGFIVIHARLHHGRNDVMAPPKHYFENHSPCFTSHSPYSWLTENS